MAAALSMRMADHQLEGVLVMPWPLFLVLSVCWSVGHPSVQICGVWQRRAIGSASRYRCRHGEASIRSGVQRRLDSISETWKVALSFSKDSLTKISCDYWALILVRSSVCHQSFLKLILAPLSSRCKQEPWRCNCDFSAPCTWSPRMMITQVWTLTSKHLMYPSISFVDIS